MKILIIHNRYQHRGGEDNVVESEKKMLEGFGHEVVLYQRSNSEINQFSFVRKIKFILKELYWSRETYTKIQEVIRKEKPDIAHIHNTFLVISPSVYKVCYDEKVPVVQTLHNYRFLCPIGTFYRNGKVCEDCLKYGRRSAVINRCWKKSYFASFFLVKAIVNIYKRQIFSKLITQYIALSEFGKKKYVDNGFDEQKFSIKPNFIDFDPGMSEQKGMYGIFVGAMQPYKGLTVLIESWKNLEQNFPLKIIGGGSLQNKIAAAVKGTNIEYLGPKPLSETIIQIKKALFVVVPSECYETCPRVIVEAYACGIPVIASNMEPIRELVIDGKTGMLFECGNSADLIEKIKYLLNNKEKAFEMGKQARKIYEQKYSLEENYNKLKEIYDQTIVKYKKEENLVELS